MSATSWRRPVVCLALMRSDFPREWMGKPSTFFRRPPCANSYPLMAKVILFQPDLMVYGETSTTLPSCQMMSF